MDKTQIPAGEYWIGDPCYMFTHDEWTTVVETIFADAPKCPDGQPFVAFSTKWGDGEYKGSDGYAYGVDAGLLGIVPASGTTADESELKRLCYKTVFTEPQDCWNEDGILHFGPITIDTVQQDDEARRVPALRTALLTRARIAGQEGV